MARDIKVRWTELSALKRAWNRVRRNKGMAGGDGQTLDHFESHLEARLIALSKSLNGHYQPSSIKRIAIEKPGGGKRLLSIPSVRDRIAQAACAEALDQLFDPKMSNASFAYRRHRSVDHAAGQVMTWRLRGYEWAVDGDIREYFDRIPHDALMNRLARDVSCHRTLRTVRIWLKGWSTRNTGIAQGSPLSPLLANIYLTDLDHLLDGKRTKLVRYADDFLVLTRTRTEAERALARIEVQLKALGLEIHQGKTSVRHFREGIQFLGVKFPQAGCLHWKLRKG